MGSLASQADAVDENMHMVSGADEMEVAAVLLIFFRILPGPLCLRVSWETDFSSLSSGSRLTK